MVTKYTKCGKGDSSKGVSLSEVGSEKESKVSFPGCTGMVEIYTENVGAEAMNDIEGGYGEEGAVGKSWYGNGVDEVDFGGGANR